MSARLSNGAGFERGNEISVIVNGEMMTAREGEVVATLLFVAGTREWKRSPAGKTRGLYCGIGLCFECLADVGGSQERACITPVRDGMVITTAEEDND